MLAFIYASCSDVNGCPLANAVLQKLASRLAEEPELARTVRLVSLSFDPEHDTPEVMDRQGRSLAREGVDWRFLTTRSRAELQPLLDAYGQSVVRERDSSGAETGPIAHILRVFLIDAERRVRNVYTVSFLHADTLLADLKTVLMDERSPVVAAAAAPSAPPELRPGDDRAGYEARDWRTRSIALGARPGRRADLLARLDAQAPEIPALPTPSGNPLTAEKVALGRRLFFDRRLSHNETFSCAMCHVAEHGFTSHEQRTAIGVEGRTVRRNAPTLLNVGYSERLFHDGREATLEAQIWGPLLARNEMANPSVGAVLERIAALPGYQEAFEDAFPERGLGMETLGMALASYQRTLVAIRSPFERWRRGGDALSPSARRGFEIFAGRGGCAGCHPVDSPLLSDGGYHNTGVGYARAMGDPTARSVRVQVAPGTYLDVDRELLAPISEPAPSDLGRYEITGDPNDRWRYRTPTLRNVALTAPYMHDGSLSTLEEVVAFYDRGGVPNEGLDPRIRKLGLRDREKRDLVTFLESLTSEDVDELVADARAAPVGERD